MALGASYTKKVGSSGTVDNRFFREIAGRKTYPIRSSITPFYQRTISRSLAKYSGLGHYPQGSMTCWTVGTMCEVGGSPTSADVKVRNAAYARAYGAFFESVRNGDTASIGTFLAEASEGLEMVAGRAEQLVTAWRRIRRGNFRGFCKALQIRPKNKDKKTRWTRPKDASAIWLEYWFGWAPSVSDIQTGLEILTRDVPHSTVTESKSFRFARKSAPGTPSWWWNDGMLHCKLRADVACTNPNLHLAKTLGLTNPASVALDLIPFSWLAGWFTNVSQVVGSLDDTLGLSFNNCWRTWHLFARGENYFASYGELFRQETYVTRREPWSIQAPPLVLKWPKSLSLSRAATSTALLASLFNRG